MSKFLYSLVVRLYGIGIYISSINSKKAKQWVRGRKNWRQELQRKLEPVKAYKKVWVHCASYGEFEQGRPLIEAISKKHPEYKIILSFFSPSGYEAFKDWTGAHAVVYLPLDTKSNAHDFIEIVDPKVAVFIKYEFWLHVLNRLKQKAVSVYLVSAVFKPHHPFFKWYGGIFRSSLNVFTKLFVQDKSSANLLKGIHINRVEIAGDTRFDRVMSIKQMPYENEIIKTFKGNKKLIVAGSTWPGDDELILKAFDKIKDKGVQLIIAPHEIETRHTINLIKKINQQGLKYSLYSNNPDTDAEVLIIDSIGILSKLYRYADCAYVGGGFNDGLHNVLEPTVNLIPVSFYGENYHNYNEAMELIALHVAQKANDAKQLKEIFKQQLFDEDYLKLTKIRTAKYFEENGNVTEKVLRSIEF